jgi:hypothetical protein
MLATKIDLSNILSIKKSNPLATLNPFYTPEYIAYRIDRGFVPWLLYSGNVDIQCLAFMKTGRVRCSLEIPSIPAFSATDKFWGNLIAFCRKEGISDLSINSFNSHGGEIPEVGIELVRKTRREYLLNLKHPDFLKKLSKGHTYRIKKARKLGLEFQRRRDPDAIAKHAELISASMQRRKKRGENVGTSVAVENLSNLINSRVGIIFCAVLNEEILSSNLVLLSDKTGYSHTMGTSPEGMASGAAHFLINEIASALKREGKDKFNLGGTDDPNPESGLVKFKTGFGASVEQIELQSAGFRLSNPLACMVQRYFSLIGRKN